MTAIAYHHQRPGSGGLIRLVREVAQHLAKAHRASVERRALAELDPYLLADIGLDRAGVRSDADHPVGRGAPDRRFG
jgi:uncharacterized protein YjiS (DUF1127 family)